MSQSHARKQRRIEIANERRGSGQLDRRNEALSAQNKTLHPTRGFRKINPKRTHAQTVMAMIFQGFTPDLRALGQSFSELPA